MRIALVQHDVCFEDAAATCRHLAPLVKEAAAAGAELVVLTEMFATGFSMAPERAAEPRDEGVGGRFLREMAAGTGAAICGSLPVLDPGADRPVNRFVCCTPEGGTVQYEKVHPFSFAGEDDCYSAGPAVVTFSWQGIAITPQICYDLRFGDGFWAVADRTDCYVVVANWPEARREHFRALVLARAIENQAYVLATNRVGTGGGLNYSGGTIAVGPFGEVLAEAGPGEETLMVDISAAHVGKVRASYPFLADRRPFSTGPVQALPGGVTTP